MRSSTGEVLCSIGVVRSCAGLVVFSIEVVLCFKEK